MDTFRDRYNTKDQVNQSAKHHFQKVVFLPTSDSYWWIKKHLINKNDTYFTRWSGAEPPSER